MTDNIKAFLEADALRTQGDPWETWEKNNCSTGRAMNVCSSEDTHIAELRDEYYADYDQVIANATFIAAASRIAPDLAKMVEDMRVAREALAYAIRFAHRDSIDRDYLKESLARLKPYEKLFEKEGER